LSHSENQRQLSVNNFWSCILGNQGIVWMYKLITVLLNTLVLLNITHIRKNIDSKIADVPTCKVFKHRLLDVSWVILIKYTYWIAKARAFYECTDGPVEQQANNPPNSDGLGAVHLTIPKLTVRVDWRPGPPIWRKFGSDPDLDPKWQSGIVANTTSGWKWIPMLFGSICDI